MRQGSLNRAAASNTLLLLVFGGTAVALAVASRGVTEAEWGLQSFLGVLLALAAATGTAISSASFAMLGEDVALRAMDGAIVGASGTREDSETKRITTTTSGVAIAHGAHGIAAVVMASIWTLLGGSLQVGEAGVGYAIAAGALTCCGNWMFYQANHLARDNEGQISARINGIFYAAPVIGIVLLWRFGDSTILYWNMLIAGLAGILAINMVIHLDPEGIRQPRADDRYSRYFQWLTTPENYGTRQDRPHPVASEQERGVASGYTSAVLALWTCGTMVLLREDVLPDSWRVWSVSRN